MIQVSDDRNPWGRAGLLFALAGLAVGWPEQNPRLSLRLPLSTTVMVDTYSDESLIDEVQAYDQRREHIEQTPPQQQRMVEEFGVTSDYGWSENRTRQYSRPAREDFGRYLRRQGFNLE